MDGIAAKGDGQIVLHANEIFTAVRACVATLGTEGDWGYTVSRTSTAVVSMREEARTAVRFLDLSDSHRELTPGLLIEFEQVIDAGCFINGPQVADFERAFARFCTSRCGVCVGSGLDALRIGLIALGVERGCEVIVPVNTFVATVEAIEQAGLVPVLVDVTDIDYNCDLGAVEAAMTARTQVLLPVHLYGQMADMRALLRLARRRGLAVVEDACQAHGAERDGLRAGSGGHVGAFSFYPGKNLGAMGDAGALVCDDPSLAERARSLREHGQTSKHRHESVGYTARLDTLQAVVLLQKLPLLEAWTRARRGLADHYAEGLDGIGDLRLPQVPMASEPVWHLYEIRTKHRDPLARFLDTRGIQTGLHYPTPIHLTPAFAHLGYRRGDFPVAEQLAGELLSLPLYPGLDADQVDLVVETIREYFHQ